MIKIVECGALAAVLSAAAACNNVGPTVSGSSNPFTIGESGVATPVPYDYSPGVRSIVVGPEGGLLKFGIGSIEFPPGALERLVTITATPEPEHFAISFAPHGLEFPAEARPVLRFRLRDAELRHVQIAYVDQRNIVLELLPTAYRNEQAGAELSHFSVYIMGAH